MILCIFPCNPYPCMHACTQTLGHTSFQGSITLVEQGSTTPVRYAEYSLATSTTTSTADTIVSQHLHAVQQNAHQSNGTSGAMMTKTTHINVAPYPTTVKRSLPTPRKVLATPPSTPGSLTYSPQASSLGYSPQALANSMTYSPQTTPVRYYHTSHGPKYIAKALVPGERTDLGNMAEILGTTPLTPPATPQSENMMAM